METQHRTAPDRSIAVLSRELFGEMQALARAEAALVKSEVHEKIGEAKKGMTSLAVGGAILHAGLLVLLASAVFALDKVLELWLAALIVGAAVAALGLIFMATGKKKMGAENLKPERSLNEVNRTYSYVKEQAR